MDNLEKMDKFLETCNLPKPKQEEIENLCRLITSNEIKSVIKKLPTNKSPGPNGFTHAFFQTLRVNTYSPQTQKKKKEGTGKLPSSFYEANITQIPKPDKDTTKENYRLLPLMNIDAKIVNKILVNHIQLFIKRIIYHDQVEFILGM